MVLKLGVESETSKPKLGALCTKPVALSTKAGVLSSKLDFH